MAIAGIDVGSTGVKCSVYSLSGQAEAEAYREYASAREIAGAALDVFHQALDRYGKTDVTAVCATSFGESFLLTDAALTPLTGMLWNTDERGNEELADFLKAFPAQRIRDICALTPHPMYSAAKLLHLLRAQPQLFDGAPRLYYLADYVLALLGGEHVTDVSLASRSMFFDVNTRSWSRPILAAMGADPAMLPAVAPTGAITGTLRPDIAARHGLSHPVALVIGGHDQIANAVGAGVLRPGMAVNGIGTVDCITPLFRPQDAASLPEHHFAQVPYALDGLCATYAFQFTGGALLRWFRDSLAPDLARAGENPYDALLAALPPTSGNLLAVPTLSGTATPDMVPFLRGAVRGLDAATGRPQLMRAFLEGEVFLMKRNLDALASCSVAPDRLRTTGGGSRSDLWMQLRADVFGLPVVRLNFRETGAAGCVMLAGTATGEFHDLDQAAQALVREARVFEPDLRMRGYYEEKYQAFTTFYQTMLGECICQSYL